MGENESGKIVIFGAGNIGRSFIAPIFIRGGYKVVFADVAPEIIAALKERNHYTLVEKTNEGNLRHDVGPVRIVDARDAAALARELDGSDICVTCVGAGALPVVLQTIVHAITRRQRPLNIILAENLKGAGRLARQIFEKEGVSANEQKKRMGIIETSIGKMVPLIPRETAISDPLLCWAEPYNTLIVDRDGFIGTIPEIPDLVAVSPVAPWVARKLYIHNFGHAAAAYIGHVHQPEAVHVRDVLENQLVMDKVERAMHIAGKALCMEYPAIFSDTEIKLHIADLISRFKNRPLGDTVYRVGRDLSRKLQRWDRVVGVLALVRKHGLDTEPALEVFQAALEFHAVGPNGLPDKNDARIFDAVHAGCSLNPESFLRNILRIDPETEPELSRLLIHALQRFCQTD